MPLQPATGTRDLNPQQVESNHQLTKQLAELYRLWGYEEVSPPKVERLDTLMAGGAINSHEIVRLVADEPLGLRPEMTVSIARAACTRLSSKSRPLRLSSSGTIFQSRESAEGGVFIQENLHSGVELFGVRDIAGEMELLSLLLKAMETLELNKNKKKPILLISHTELMNLILKSINKESTKEIREHLAAFDSLYIEESNVDSNVKTKLLEIQRIRGVPTKVIAYLESLYGHDEVLENLKRIFSMLEPLADSYGIRLQLDPTFQPQFELYKGIVFELVCESEAPPIVIARGGRYDELVERFGGKDQCNTGLGFSISIDRIQELKGYINQYSYEHTSILVSYGPESSLERALKIQKKFHEEGIKAIVELQPCDNKAQANSLLKQRNCNELRWVND